MINQRNLGPVLAAAGAVLAAVAIIAGFIITGGPGDARDKRLDRMTDDNLMAVLNVVQCAFNGSDVAPASFDDAIRSNGWTSQPDKTSLCINWRGKDLSVPTGGTPTSPGEVTYEVVSPTRIRVCAFYQRPDAAHECSGCYKGDTYDNFFAARPAGLHCYDIDMVAQPTLDNFPAAGRATEIEIFQ